jgi:hypothetical protein
MNEIEEIYKLEKLKMKQSRVEGGSHFLKAFVDKVCEKVEQQDAEKRLLLAYTSHIFTLFDNAADFARGGFMETCYECGDQVSTMYGGDKNIKECPECDCFVCSSCECTCWWNIYGIERLCEKQINDFKNI